MTKMLQTINILNQHSLSSASSHNFDPKFSGLAYYLVGPGGEYEFIIATAGGCVANTAAARQNKDNEYIYSGISRLHFFGSIIPFYGSSFSNSIQLGI